MILFFHRTDLDRIIPDYIVERPLAYKMFEDISKYVRIIEASYKFVTFS